MDAKKQAAITAIDVKKDVVCHVADTIWANPELSLQEVKSAALYCEVLKREGFQVERGVCGIPTAFAASFGSGKPHIGILAEYDALSGLSQKAGSLTQEELIPGGCGHGCGHNLLGAGALAAALGVKAYLEAAHISGTVTLYGCPGEEGGAAKAFMARDGLWRQLDAALTWHPEDSIDFENGMVLIRHTVCKMIVTVEKDKTKTQSSRRSFPMTEEAREIFLKAKAEEEENQRLFGKAYQKNDYVFKWPDGRTFAPDYVTHHFSKMLERYGMPHIRFHELRHSCASLLLNNGCGLKDVQEWMGHSDIQTTANIYGHLDTSRKQSLADKLTECLHERR